MFKIGSKVATATSSYCDRGSKGTIVTKSDTPKIWGVEFDEIGNGHDLNGFLNRYNGWWIYESELVLLEPNKEEQTMNPVSNMAKKFLDADTQSLIEAGYLSSNLELTNAGISVRDEIMFDAAQKELIKAAKAKIAEAKKT